MSAVKKVSIIGGGLGGLALAQFLKSIPTYQVTVFERDETPLHRSQGYQIGIHGYGYESLKTLNLNGLDALLSENPMNGVMILDGKTLKPYVTFPTKGASLVNRWKLRDLLLQDLQNGRSASSSSSYPRIEWNKKFVSYKVTESEVKAIFEDGTEIFSDFLIGADGVNSKVRKLYRPDLKFESVGIGSIAGFMEVNDKTAAKMKGIESYLKMIEGNLVRSQLPLRHSLLTMKFIAHSGKPQILWAISYDKNFYYHHNEGANHHPVHVISADLSPKQVKANLLKRIEGFDCSPEILHIIEATPEKDILRMKDYTSMVPTKNAHLNSSPSSQNDHLRVTLLGDAAHAMTSHGGLGANTAFKDAYEMARFLDTMDWDNGFAPYEKDMFERGYKAVTFSLGNTKRIHSDPSLITDAILRMMGVFVKAFTFFQKK